MAPPKHAPPKHDPDVWLFDLDNTLYPARCNLFAQIDVRIGRYIADWLKVDVDEARRVQKQYWRDHGTSMRGMMSLHGVDPRGGFVSRSAGIARDKRDEPGAVFTAQCLAIGQTRIQDSPGLGARSFGGRAARRAIEFVDEIIGGCRGLRTGACSGPIERADMA